MPSVVFYGEESSLVALRAVSAGYPLRGRLRVADVPFGAGRPVDGIPARGEAWADSRLLARLDAPLGSQVSVGSLQVTVTRVLDYRPDQGAGFADLSATLMINMADMDATGLVQPGNNAPAYREARRGEDQSITFRAPADRRMIQSEGQTWRAARNGPLTVWGGWLLAGVFLAIAAFYLWRGKITLEGQPTGRLIQRFSSVERMAHWTVAGCFVILALSGLTMLFGKHVLLPVVGYTLFSWLAWAAKNLHNLVGPLFFAAILLFMALFAKDNVWHAVDALWIRKAGGLLSGEHVPSWRFNFGEKTWFWLGNWICTDGAWSGTLKAPLVSWPLKKPSEATTRSKAEPPGSWLVFRLRLVLTRLVASVCQFAPP